MRITLLIFLAVVSVLTVTSQVPLASFIGQNSLPSDGDSICYIPIYPEVSTDLPEPLEGELVHDFKLYTLEGDSVRLSGVLNDGKPVLLIGCNYTCYVYRGKVDVINDMVATYGDLLNIYLVYTVEAHPIIDFSPYFGYENVGDQNYAEGILYRQPVTYGERKDIASDMLENMTINAPVLIDGPCNEWWMNYGTNPNPAWLIAPDGIVYDAQKWFNKEPEDMYASIDSMLNIVGEGVYTPTGTFDAEIEELETGDIFYGTVENTIPVHFTLTNTSDDDVLIDFVRSGIEIPDGWFSTMCTELCYSPDIDSTTVYLTPGASQVVRVDFFTDEIPAPGFVHISCKNHYDDGNDYEYDVSVESVAEPNAVELFDENVFAVFPNPVLSDQLHFIYQPVSGGDFQILGIDGKLIQSGSLANSSAQNIFISLDAGNYFLVIRDGDSVLHSSFSVL